MGGWGGCLPVRTGLTAMGDTAGLMVPELPCTGDEGSDDEPLETVDASSSHRAGESGSDLQIGQVRALCCCRCLSHSSTQSRWKACEHGSRRKQVPVTYGSRHRAHVGSQPSMGASASHDTTGSASSFVTERSSRATAGSSRMPQRDAQRRM